MKGSQVDQNVFLTPVSLSPRGDDERCMYVCDRVQESVIRRSSVLTALHETTGVVQLPNGISVRAFLVWKKAADGGAEPSVSELATAIRVCRSSLHRFYSTGRTPHVTTSKHKIYTRPRTCCLWFAVSVIGEDGLKNRASWTSVLNML